MHAIVDARIRQLATSGLDADQPPDLVLLSGDLAPRARPDEYQVAQATLDAIREALALRPDQVIVVPGDTDVSRLRCQAYFLECEADGVEPVAPYWEKWRPLAGMLHQFNGTTMAKDQPWSLTEFTTRKIVVAGMNSTMAATHLDTDTAGSLGPDQINWFADRLGSGRYRDWLRIGLLHHRPDAGDGPIRDAPALAEAADCFDLLIHGQRCPGDQVTGLWQNTPVIGADPAGGWKLVEVEPDAIVVRDDAGRRAAMSRPAPNRGAPLSTARSEATRPIDHDRLIEQVVAVCLVRYPHAQIGVIPWSGPAATRGYLRISPMASSRTDLQDPLSQQPVGIWSEPPSRADIQQFLTEVLARFRISGTTAAGTIVYFGRRADRTEREWARSHGVDLLTFAEFELGDALDDFSREQLADLDHDQIYRPDWYVPQRYTEITRRRTTDDEITGTDLLGELRAWIDRPDGRLMVVLGTFGHGKTFLLRELARRMHHDGCQTLPVLIDLRGFEKTYSLDDLFMVQLSRREQRRIDLDTFRHLRRAGRIALLFDGFDELAARVSYDRAASHLHTILQAAEGNAKVVLTSREQHFLADSDVTTALDTRPESAWRMVKLAGFDDTQIMAFLSNALGDPVAARDRLRLLREVEDLLGLSRNPRMLAFATDLSEAQLLAAKTSGGGVTPSGLYRQIIYRWLDHEASRLRRFESLETNADELLDAVTHLALRLREVQDASLGIEDLDQAAGTIARLKANTIGDSAGLEPPEAVHLLGSSTLLVRSGEQRFAFVHHSVKEWLVANHLAEQITSGGPAVATGYLFAPTFSPLLIDFLCGIAGRETTRDWATRTLAGPGTSAAIGRNAAAVLNHLGALPPVQLNLAGLDLRGENYSARRLCQADLSGADLTRGRLIGTDLTGATLRGTRLIGARLDRATLRRADLTAADLTGASLLGAELGDAVLTRASLRRAALIGATEVGQDAFATADTLGAALPNQAPPLAQFGASSPVQAVATDQEGAVVAGAGLDGTIRLWDTTTGRAVRVLAGHVGPVATLAFAKDGRRLASAGQDGRIRVWDITTGAVLRTLVGSTAWVATLAFSPDGRWLASTGHDPVVQIWNLATGTVRTVLEGHDGWVHTVGFSPDGGRLVSAGEDETVRIWDLAGSGGHRICLGHIGSVRAAVFAPSGAAVASGGDDRTIILWDPNTGEATARIRDRHPGWIRSLVYHPEGHWLASAGDEGRIRLWSQGNPHLIAELAEHTGVVRALAVNDDGKLLVSAGDDRTVRVWDCENHRQQRVLGGEPDEPRVLCFTPDGRRLVSGTGHGVVQIWDAVAGTRPRFLPCHASADPVDAIAAAPNGIELASADGGTVRIWNVETATVTARLAASDRPVRTLAYAPNGDRIACAGDEGTILIWDPSATTALRVIGKPTGSVRALAYAPDGASLAAAGSDHVVRIWDVATGGTSQVITRHTGAVRAMAYARDGSFLVSAGDDGTIRIWNPGTGASTITMASPDEAHQISSLAAIAIAPDGRRVASAAQNGTLRLWDLASRTVVSEVVAHAGPIRSIVYSPDGQTIASAGTDRLIRLWHAEDLRLRANLVPLSNGGSAVVLGDSRYLTDGDVRGEFWYAAGLCRFEPGELDPYLPQLGTVPTGEPLW